MVLPFLLSLRGSHNRTFQRVSLVISDPLTRRKPVELEFNVASVPEPQRLILDVTADGSVLFRAGLSVE